MSDEFQRPSIAVLLTQLAIAAAGVYLFARPGELGLYGTVWAIAMIVGGGSLFLLALVARIAPTPAEVAKSQAALEQGLYGSPHERRRADEDTIRAYGLDLHYYRTRTDELRALKFRGVGDYVDVTAERAARFARAVIRAFISDDGATMAAIYDVRIRGWPWLAQRFGLISKDMRILEMETELSDGTFACTSDAHDAALAAEVPGVSRVFVRRGSTAREMLDEHRSHVRRLLDARPAGVVARPVRTFQDLAAAQDRLQAMKSAFRRSPAFDPLKESERIMGRPLNGTERRVVEDAARLRAEADEPSHA